MGRILFTYKKANPICFGYLYNWYAVDDSRNITSSDDWVVPTVSQWYVLINYEGHTDTGAAGRLKETGYVYWNSPNTGATNEYGFGARGGGIRSYVTGSFSGLLNSTRILLNRSDGIAVVMSSISANTSYNAALNDGSSIRLLYVGSGTPTEYIGNDGKTYNVVQIGTQYWISENLEETQYRNGDGIAFVEDNALWASLNYGAGCVYNNDLSNACKTPLPVYDINPPTIQPYSFTVTKQQSIWNALSYPYIDVTNALNAYGETSIRDLIGNMTGFNHDYSEVEYIEVVTYSSNNANHQIIYNGVELSVGDKIYNNGTTSFEYGTIKLKELSVVTSARTAVIGLRFKFINTNILSNVSNLTFGVNTA